MSRDNVAIYKAVARAINKTQAYPDARNDYCFVVDSLALVNNICAELKAVDPLFDPERFQAASWGEDKW